MQAEEQKLNADLNELLTTIRSLLDKSIETITPKENMLSVVKILDSYPRNGEIVVEDSVRYKVEHQSVSMPHIDNKDVQKVLEGLALGKCAVLSDGRTIGKLLEKFSDSYQYVEIVRRAQRWPDGTNPTPTPNNLEEWSGVLASVAMKQSLKFQDALDGMAKNLETHVDLDWVRFELEDLVHVAKLNSNFDLIKGVETVIEYVKKQIQKETKNDTTKQETK